VTLLAAADASAARADEWLRVGHRLGVDGRRPVATRATVTQQQVFLRWVT
jgi:hypothetical protein